MKDKKAQPLPREVASNGRKGKKDIVLHGTHVSDPLNERKRRKWGRNGIRV